MILGYLKRIEKKIDNMSEEEIDSMSYKRYIYEGLFVVIIAVVISFIGSLT